jgi:hypothetical protein
MLDRLCTLALRSISWLRLVAVRLWQVHSPESRLELFCPVVDSIYILKFATDLGCSAFLLCWSLWPGRNFVRRRCNGFVRVLQSIGVYPTVEVLQALVQHHSQSSLCCLLRVGGKPLAAYIHTYIHTPQ